MSCRRPWTKLVGLWRRWPYEGSDRNRRFSHLVAQQEMCRLLCLGQGWDIHRWALRKVCAKCFYQQGSRWSLACTQRPCSQEYQWWASLLNLEPRLSLRVHPYHLCRQQSTLGDYLYSFYRCQLPQQWSLSKALLSLMSREFLGLPFLIFQHNSPSQLFQTWGPFACRVLCGIESMYLRKWSSNRQVCSIRS